VSKANKFPNHFFGKFSFLKRKAKILSNIKDASHHFSPFLNNIFPSKKVPIIKSWISTLWFHYLIKTRLTKPFTKLLTIVRCSLTPSSKRDLSFTFYNVTPCHLNCPGACHRKYSNNQKVYQNTLRSLRGTCGYPKDYLFGRKGRKTKGDRHLQKNFNRIFLDSNLFRKNFLRLLFY